MRKVFSSPVEALEGVLFDGMSIMSGGWPVWQPGKPDPRSPRFRVKDLTIISNNAGAEGLDLWMLQPTRQVRKMISSYVGDNKLFEQQYLDVRSSWS